MIQDNRCQLCLANSQGLERVAHYDLKICRACKHSNQHGWQQQHEPTLREGLARNGLFIPDRNADGLLPFHYSPPADFAI